MIVEILKTFDYIYMAALVYFFFRIAWNALTNGED